MRSNNGVYVQNDGLAVCIQPDPLLANIWLSQFDDIIKGERDIYFRYMDDVSNDVLGGQGKVKLNEINSLHPKLKLNLEVLTSNDENEDEAGRIAF